MRLEQQLFSYELDFQSEMDMECMVFSNVELKCWMGNFAPGEKFDTATINLFNSTIELNRNKEFFTFPLTLKVAE